LTFHDLRKCESDRKTVRARPNSYSTLLIHRHHPRSDIAPAQAVKTLVHELGHALLHGDELPRSKKVAEVEVESVAYIVCDTLGLDSGEYSFPYVTRWAEGSSDLVGETAERAIGCAKQILERLVVSSDGADI
jgi:hypothetical protein